MAQKKGEKKVLGKGLGALIRHYDLDEEEVKQKHDKQRTKETKDEEVGRLSVYKKALAQAHQDGVISNDEEMMLKTLREYLIISDTEHEVLEEQVLRKRK
jgi:hypothetical protein